MLAGSYVYVLEKYNNGFHSDLALPHSTLQLKPDVRTE